MILNEGSNLIFRVVWVLGNLLPACPLDPPLTPLGRTGRSLRAFRVIRLFGRLGSLRDIIAALTAAVVPVLNAFLIMFIVGSICEPIQFYRGSLDF
jgi:hypothetical protein